MKTIGLVGGVASGKSLVAKMLIELGAGVLDADRAGHAVLAEDVAVQDSLRKRWGESVFNWDGAVDRKAIARRVFAAGDAALAERRFLEKLVHPKIRDRLKTELSRLASEGHQIVVLDAALLFEADWATLCDLVVFVDSPRETRLKRALTRGWTESEFDSREAAQWPVDDKRLAADVVLANSGTEAELRAAVRDFWRQNVVSTA